MISLRGIAWDHPRGYDPMVATATAFSRLRPDVTIEWHKRSLHDFGHAPVDRLAAEYDLVVLDHPWVGFMADRGSYLPLDEWLPPAVLDDLARHSAGPSHSSYAWQGHQWAIAIDAATPSASYRPDLLAALGAAVPRTWGEVLALAARCREAGRFVAMPLCPVDAITAFVSLAANSGAEPFATADQVVSRDAGLRVLDALQAIAALCPAEVFEWSPIRLMDRMSTTDDLVYCPHAYSYNNYARPGFRPHRCRYADMPALGSDGPGGSHIGGTGLAVSRSCRHPREAVDYAALVAGAEWQKTIYFQAGGQPAHAAAWDDQAVNAAAGDFFRDTRATIEGAFVRPRHDGYIDFQYDGGALITSCLRDRGDHRRLLDDLNRLYSASLKHPA